MIQGGEGPFSFPVRFSRRWLLFHEVNSLTDQQLLREYAERRSEAAFAELVRRHVDLIYSAALRLVCDSHLAQDESGLVARAENLRCCSFHKQQLLSPRRKESVDWFSSPDFHSRA